MEGTANLANRRFDFVALTTEVIACVLCATRDFGAVTQGCVTYRLDISPPSDCNATCGGFRTRTVQCLAETAPPTATATASAGATGSTSPVPTPGPNAAAGGSGASSVPPPPVNIGSSAPSTGGGGHSRVLASGNGNGDRTNVTVVALELCLSAGMFMPPLTMPCAACYVSFCNTTRCSNHGTCDVETDQCACDDGYSGRV